MKLVRLFAMQKELDMHIETTHQLKEENLIQRKVLALLVELGEFANETRCFKFWSVKGASPKETILEEYVDGIHFLLSLGIEFSLHDMDVITSSERGEDVTEQFLKVYDGVLGLRTEPNRQSYVEVFGDYLALGEMLGFTNEDVEDAYMSKNEVNYQRQKEGY
ncbi:dUTP diphosphatase [Priestia koreensis]|uniref:dUTPase n=1 Tax=Priestia koreensis TaxID=284581 RepID=A0A0M0L762_9BACI|nr:dUTP diphosphatase [Priestia koreensis]KOO46874.1 dUTPase [Priestia koreensis]